jgi:L-fuconolactonase
MIDSHQHFWRYDTENYGWIDDNMAVIRKDFFPEDFKPILDYYGFEGSVLVQVKHDEAENEEFLQHAEANDFIKGVVCWVDFMAANLQERLQYYKTRPKVKGFRHVAQGEPDDFLTQPAFIEGVKQLNDFDFTYDILIVERQLKSALHFIRQLPESRLIVDHIAKPEIRNKSLISQHQNVYVKVSGMVTEANYSNWKKEDFFIYLDHVLEYFGTDRIVYGSDWPVCLVAAEYGEQLDIVQSYFEKLSKTEQDKIFGGNAKRFYKL